MKIQRKPALNRRRAPANIRPTRVGNGSQSPVAQLVEQAAVNRLVTGSSPVGGASQTLCEHYPLVTPVIEGFFFAHTAL